MRKYAAAVRNVLIVIAVVLLLLSCTQLPDNSSTEPEIIIEKPQPTRSVTWYTSSPQIFSERFANAFTNKTGIDVKIVRNSTFIIRDRLMSEIENGSTEADVLNIADIGTFIELRNRGLLMKYDSPYYKDYPEQYKDLSFWVISGAFGICMAYDESKITDPPKHWTDLLDEKWQGRIGLEDIDTAGSQYCEYYILREILGKEFWEKLLSTQKPKIYYRTEELANALLEGDIDIAGEFSIYTVYNFGVKRGTTIQGIYPEEGIPFVLTPVAIMKDAKHIEEAKIFFDFFLSREGQELMQQLTYKYSVRKDVLPLQGKPPLDVLNILSPKNPNDYLEKRDEYIKEFDKLLKGDG